MNRPFYAIGVLLAFLAVAMMAVGLSSRPTRQPASAQSGSGITKPRRGPGSVVFLLAIPDEVAEDVGGDLLAAESEAPEIDVAAEQPSYAHGCGLDRTTGVVYDGQCAGRMTLKPALVEVADQAEILESFGRMDCYSHCDPAYDAAVYGEASLHQNSDQYGNSSTSVGSVSDEDPTLTLFRSFLGEQFEARVVARPQTKAASRNWRYELNAWTAGAANQAQKTAERLGLADECERWGALLGMASQQAEAVASLPSWGDYQDWSESEQAGVAGQDTPAGGKAAILSHPAQKLLQIAVASLNHAAKTLAAAAEQLDSLDPQPAAGPIGWRSTDAQPR